MQDEDDDEVGDEVDEEESESLILALVSACPGTSIFGDLNRREG